MLKKYIFVKTNELSEYNLFEKASNRLQEFWNTIFVDLPYDLKNEINFENVILSPEPVQRFSITGVLPYRFKVEGCNDSLDKVLTKYIIFVEHETPAVRDWKRRINETLLNFA